VNKISTGKGGERSALISGELHRDWLLPPRRKADGEVKIISFSCQKFQLRIFDRLQFRSFVQKKVR